MFNTQQNKNLLYHQVIWMVPLLSFFFLSCFRDHACQSSKFSVVVERDIFFSCFLWYSRVFLLVVWLPKVWVSPCLCHVQSSMMCSGIYGIISNVHGQWCICALSQQYPMCTWKIMVCWWDFRFTIWLFAGSLWSGLWVDLCITKHVHCSLLCNPDYFSLV